MVDTYGLVMIGLKETSDYTEDFPRVSGYRVDIFYDRDNGNVWGKFHISDCSWTEYHDPAIIKVASTNRHWSMQHIANAVKHAVEIARAMEGA